MEAASFPPCLGKPPRGFARTPVSLTLAHTSGRRHESASAENRHHATSLKVLVTAKAPRTHEDHRWSRFSRILIIRCWAKWCRSSRTSGAPSRERSHSFVSSPDFEGFTRWPSPTHDATLPPAETYTPLPWTQPRLPIGLRRIRCRLHRDQYPHLDRECSLRLNQRTLGIWCKQRGLIRRSHRHHPFRTAACVEP
jgi:hypothetical protein